MSAVGSCGPPNFAGTHTEHLREISLWRDCFPTQLNITGGFDIASSLQFAEGLGTTVERLFHRHVAFEGANNDASHETFFSWLNVRSGNGKSGGTPLVFLCLEGEEFLKRLEQSNETNEPLCEKHQHLLVNCTNIMDELALMESQAPFPNTQGNLYVIDKNERNPTQVGCLVYGSGNIINLLEKNIPGMVFSAKLPPSCSWISRDDYKSPS